MSSHHRSGRQVGPFSSRTEAACGAIASARFSNRANRPRPSCVPVERASDQGAHLNLLAGDGGHRKRKLRGLIVSPGQQAQGVQRNRNQKRVIAKQIRTGPRHPWPRGARNRPPVAVFQAQDQLSTTSA
jgi:hypothetical protein